MATAQLHTHQRSDPTGTTTLRNEYAGRMFARWRTVKGLVRASLIDNNALGLIDRRPTTLAQPLDRLVPPADDAERLRVFAGWFDGALDDEVLAITEQAEGRIVERVRWQDTFIERAYRKGIRDADSSLRQQGVEVPREARFVQTPLLAAPSLRRKLELLQQANFSELQGVTQATRQQVTRQLQQGLVQGQNARAIAADINDRVDKIGITRSQTLARTKIIEAHAEASLDRFSQFGLDRVEGRSEWLTAGDARVCDRCQGLEGQTFTIGEARGLIPLHARCRCRWLPVVDRQQIGRDIGPPVGAGPGDFGRIGPVEDLTDITG